MLIELAGWVAPSGGAFPMFARAFLFILFILLGALMLLHGRTLYPQAWKTTLLSAPAVAWLLSKVERVSVAATEKPVKDPRLFLDSTSSRRLARDLFYKNHKEFDFNSTPRNDAEMGLNVSETFERNSRGLEIFMKSWVPMKGHPKGLIFLCHGYGDTVTFYQEGLARVLAVAGYAVYGMDYPGHGLSEGLHGYIPNFDRLVDDVLEQYGMIKERPEFEGLPCFLFGESMGGAVALKAHLRDESMWDGAVLVAPMCKIADAMYPPWYLVQIMIVLAHIIPKTKLVPHTDIAAIGFRDLKKRKIASHNPVAYVGNPRLGTALSLLRTTDFIESKLHEVSFPLLVLHGADDQVTDPSVSKLLHERAKSKDKTLRLYEGAWHCLLQGEPDDMVNSVMKDIITWLDVRAASKSKIKLSSDREVADAAVNLVHFGKLDAIRRTNVVVT